MTLTEKQHNLKTQVKRHPSEKFSTGCIKSGKKVLLLAFIFLIKKKSLKMSRYYFGTKNALCSILLGLSESKTKKMRLARVFSCLQMPNVTLYFQFSLVHAEI